MFDFMLYHINWTFFECTLWSICNLKLNPSSRIIYQFGLQKACTGMASFPGIEARRWSFGTLLEISKLICQETSNVCRQFFKSKVVTVYSPWIIILQLKIVGIRRNHHHKIDLPHNSQTLSSSTRTLKTYIWNSCDNKPTPTFKNNN